ncbi:hypothetical protein PTTG_27837 [Puccinia triticina 1-1 BBBD Race 1]|uniref:DUF7918 domain-containing protein n=2 Tax=Puccinia triticina TaxID=208348 RepID=A0A180GH32_PUCT1|nr:uncharacterized protein PtA15_1A122 [Puccinia triticina]OAV91884.1 hypothetical protein PTTG_27837 [Puccinia triticina 1-1 BBBD Race 1]WAQ80784.1 hypothetical protein PtA15_1A122 [Puccinia triticina]WAR51677.1 hypothetical protein PtB15_1B113 [Puccinia triticina]
MPDSDSQSLKLDDYVCNIYLDGILIAIHKRPLSISDHPRRIEKVYSNDRKTYRSLQFANVNLVDPDDYASKVGDPTDKICEDEKVIKSLGTIRVGIARSPLAPKRGLYTSPNDHKPTNQMKFSERSKKASLSTTAGLSQQSVVHRQPSPTIWDVKALDPNPFLQGTIESPAVEAVEVDTKPKPEPKEDIQKNKKRVKDEDDDEVIVIYKKSNIIDITRSSGDEL